MFLSLLICSLGFFQLMRISNCRAECFYVTGNMSADLSTEQTITFQITGSVSKFSYRYYHPSYYAYRTNTQENNRFSLSFSSEPTAQQEGIDEWGNSYTDLVWTTISDTTLDITVNQQATTKAILNPLDSSGFFPLDQGAIPKEAQMYMTGTGLVQSTDPQIRAKANELVAGCTYQFQAVENIIKWIMNNIEYGANSAYDARSTLIQKKGVCENYSHIACAMLRAESIPARYVSGISLARTYSWSVGYTTYSTSWNTGPHAWIEVCYPDLGWVPYDALRDVHHIDVFRIKEAHGRDNNDLSSISWSYYSSAPSITESESSYGVKIENETVAISCLRKTDEIASVNYALSLEVNPIAAQPATQPIASPVITPLNSPTNQKIIAIIGKAEPGSMVEVFLNGKSAGISVTTQTGSFSVSGVSLIEGSNQITARTTLGSLISGPSPAQTVVLQSQSTSIPSSGSTSQVPFTSSQIPDASRQASSVVQTPGYGVFGIPTSTGYSPAGSFGYGAVGLTGGFSSGVSYGSGNLGSTSLAAYSNPYSPTNSLVYGGLSGGGFSPVVSPVVSYEGLGSPSVAAYSSPYSPTSSFSSLGYGGGLSSVSSLSFAYSGTNSFSYGGGLSVGGLSGVGGAGFSPVASYNSYAGGLSSPSIAAYSNPYSMNSPATGFGYGGFSSSFLGGLSTLF